jgi:hypothetical protein
VNFGDKPASSPEAGVEANCVIPQNHFPPFLEALHEVKKFIYFHRYD